MTDTYRPSHSLRSVIAALGVLSLTLGLLAYAPSAQAQQPGDGPPADGSASAAQADGDISLQRHEGQTRYQTSAQIATDAYDASTEVVIASGEAFADALSGAALEGMVDAPVLLVPEDLVSGQIPQATIDAIDELGATSATILGGPDAVSDDVADYIVDNSTVQSTERVAGPTRFETAREIAEQVGDAGVIPDAVADEFGLTQGSNAAFLATGLNWPDAMAAGPGSFAGQHPILLTTPNELHGAAQTGLEAAGADVVFILGGTDVVSSDVESELNSQGYETVRLAGADRWETAREVANTFADDWGYGVGNVGLATGFTFADALASAPFLGNPAPLVLTPTGETHSATMQFFNNHGCAINTVDVFGGQQAVQTSVAQSYADTACPPAQQGSISGTVTAAGTGAPIPDADITASNSETFTATTDVDGDYTVDVDAPENYTVTAEADGFESGEQQVQVEPGEDVADVDFQLSLATNQDIPVTPSEPEVNPTDGDRDYTASGLEPGSQVEVALIEAASVTVDNGTVSLAGDGSGLADLGGTDAYLSEVGGVSQPVGTGQVAATANDDGEVALTVAGQSYESVIPIVYQGDDAGALPIDGDGLPTNDFGVGGLKQFADVDVLAMQPPADLNQFGTQHTVTATLMDDVDGDRFNNAPGDWREVGRPGATIDFTVYDRTAVDGGLSTDLPQPGATVAQQGETVAPLFAEATQQVVESGDTGSLGGVTDFQYCSDGSQPVFTDSGQIPQGAVVDSGSATTGDNGSASFSWTATDPDPEAANSAAHCVLAEWTGAQGSEYEGDSAHGTAYKQWSDAAGGQAADVSLSPEGDVNLTGSDHSTTATVTDDFGNPVEGAEVTFSVDAADDARDLTVTRTTNAEGQASFTYPGPDSLPLDDPLNEGDDADQITADVAAIDGAPDAQTIKEWSEGIVTNTATEAQYLSDELPGAEDAASSGQTLEVTGTVLGGATADTAGLTLTGDGTIALSEALNTGDSGTPALTVNALGTVVEDLTIRRSGDTGNSAQGILVEGEGAADDTGVVLRNLTVEGDLADATNAGIMVRPAGDNADFLSGVAVENNDVSGFASGVAVSLLESGGTLPAGPPTLANVVIDGNTIDTAGLGVVLGTPQNANDTPGGVVVSNNTIAATGADSFGIWLNSPDVLDADAVVGNDVSGDEPYAGVRGQQTNAVAQTLATAIATGNTLPQEDVYHIPDNLGGVPAWVIGEDPAS